GTRTVTLAIISDPAQRESVQLARLGADGSVHAPADGQRLIALHEKVRRQRALMRIEELLEERGRALRESEARWRSLFEAIPEIVMVHGDDGVIRHINQTGAQRLEWPAHDIVGRRLSDFEPAATHADGAEPINGDEVSDTTLYLSGSGEEIPVEVNR